MAAQSALVGRIVLLLGGGAVATFVGYRTFLTEAADPAPKPPAVAAASEAAPAAPAAAPAPEPVAEAPVAEPPMPPSFDVVRIEPDGAALIAGKAPADAQVSLLLDGVQESRVQADAAGNFVAQLTFAPNPAPRMLSLMATLDDGTALPGAATVVVAPIVAMVPVATEEPAATPAPPAALLVTEAGAAVISAAPEVAAGEPVPVILDAISYAPDGAVQLAGKGQAGATLRVYLDNAAIADTAVPDDGAWAMTLPETAPGIYTLRLDQLGEDGAVTSRFETPFKRETLEALALATGVAAPAAEDPGPAPEPTPEAEVQPAPPPAPVAVPEATSPVIAAPAAPEATPDVTAAPAPEAAPAAEPQPAPEAAPAPVQTAAVVPAAPVTITVQPGFTLWGIATDMMGEGTMYVQVFEANKDKIVNPDLIYPGQVFTLPQE